MPRLTVQIDPEGKAVVDIEGAKGVGCQDVAKSITRAMNGTVIESTKKKDYYEDPDAVEIRSSVKSK